MAQREKEMHGENQNIKYKESWRDEYQRKFCRCECRKHVGNFVGNTTHCLIMPNVEKWRMKYERISQSLS